MMEHRKCCDGVADCVVGRVQCFQPQVIARRIYDRLVAQTGDLRHFPQPHIGAHRNNTGEDLAWIRLPESPGNPQESRRDGYTGRPRARNTPFECDMSHRGRPGLALVDRRGAVDLDTLGTPHRLSVLFERFKWRLVTRVLGLSRIA